MDWIFRLNGCWLRSRDTFTAWRGGLKVTGTTVLRTVRQLWGQERVLYIRLLGAIENLLDENALKVA